MSLNIKCVHCGREQELNHRPCPCQDSGQPGKTILLRRLILGSSTVKALVAHAYGLGNQRGHESTVEGTFTDVHPRDFEREFADIAQDIITETLNTKS